jgi:hypothetical protein
MKMMKNQGGRGEKLFFCFCLDVAVILLRLYRFALGVLFSASAEKRYQKRQPQGTPFLRERVPYVSSQRGKGFSRF